MIIPVRNGEASIPPLLRSLDAQTLERARFEVIVVDNDSSDRTADVAAAGAARASSADRSRTALAPATGARRRLVRACTRSPTPTAWPTRDWLEALLDAGRSRHWSPATYASACATPRTGSSVTRRCGGSGRSRGCSRAGRRPRTCSSTRTHSRRSGGSMRPGATSARTSISASARAMPATGSGTAPRRSSSTTLSGSSGRCSSAAIATATRSTRRTTGSARASARGGTRGRRCWAMPRCARTASVPAAPTPREWRRMARLARLGYSARIAGSIWAELRRAR